MFKETVEKYYPEMAAIREDIHRHPELSNQEFRTSALVMEQLRSYGLDSVEQVAATGVVGILYGTAEGAGQEGGRCLAIRADMDALPVTEDTGLPFSSEVPGVMHACGHDIHTATLLTAARVLAEHRNQFRGCVKFIFQAAEEKAPAGGARPMCEAGVMENPHVDAIVALHVVPSTDKAGKFGLKKGVVSSGFDLYDFDVHGKSGHGSQPHTANDAILAVSQLIVMLQQIVSRNIDPLKTAIFSVGLLSGGTAVNIIPGEARAEGVARYYDNQSAEVIREKALDIAEGVSKLSGCQIDVKVQKGYACVENDGELIDFIEGAVKAELGEDASFTMDEPFSGSEDFSYYSIHSGVPGALMWLHAYPEGGEVYPLHNPKCVMQSDIIKTGAAGMARIAVDFLNR